MFAKQKIVITGASRGIGFEAAKLLLPQGAEILGLGRDEKRLERVAVQLRALGRFDYLAGDVAEIGTARMIAQWVESHWGKLDVLVNNAGIMFYYPANESEEDDVLEKTMRVNVLGPHQCIKALLPFLKKAPEPRIINVASGAGTVKSLETEKDMLSYRLSKYSLNGLTRVWANTLKGKVAVNSLDPGWLKTDMGGPNAPGDPKDGGQRVVQLLEKPFSETGKFWYGSKEIIF